MRPRGSTTIHEVSAIEAPELDAVKACMLALARAWRFPPTGGGSQLTASFVLSTEVAPEDRLGRLGRPRCRG